MARTSESDGIMDMISSCSKLDLKYIETNGKWFKAMLVFRFHISYLIDKYLDFPVFRGCQKKKLFLFYCGSGVKEASVFEMEVVE